MLRNSQERLAGVTSLMKPTVAPMRSLHQELATTEFAEILDGATQTPWWSKETGMHEWAMYVRMLI